MRNDIAPVRQQIHELLAKGVRCRNAKTRRFCEGLLSHETALWTFTRTLASPRLTKNPSALFGTPFTGDARATALKPMPATGSLSGFSPTAKRAACKVAAFTSTSQPRSPPSYTDTGFRRFSPPHPDQTP